MISYSELLNSVEAFLKVGDNIINVFCTNGKTDRVRLDSLVKKLSIVQLAVRRGRRMNDKALDVGYIGEKRENPEVVDEGVRFFDSALDFKGEDRTAALREVFFIKCMVGMIGKRRMVDVLNLGIVYKILYNLLRVFACRSRRRESVSTPCKSRKAANGEMVAPISRSKIARI